MNETKSRSNETCVQARTLLAYRLSEVHGNVTHKLLA